MPHPEILKYYQSTSKAPAKAPQNLTVRHALGQVEQWARAMFTDQVFHAGSPPPGSAGGAIPAPAGILSAAVDRLRSLAAPVAFPSWGPSTASQPSPRPPTTNPGMLKRPKAGP